MPPRLKPPLPPVLDVYGIWVCLDGDGGLLLDHSRSTQEEGGGGDHEGWVVVKLIELVLRYVFQALRAGDSLTEQSPSRR